jgi:hypothetical protein
MEDYAAGHFGFQRSSLSMYLFKSEAADVKEKAVKKGAK